MDVTFTNVLEGARQYFQGLPTGTSSTVGPPYATDGLRRNDLEQNQDIPPSSNSYWPPQPTDPVRPPTREHTPVQRPSSHSSDSSRPPSHSQYNPNLEQSRIHYPTSYQEQYTTAQQQQQQQQPQQHSQQHQHQQLQQQQQQPQHQQQQQQNQQQSHQQQQHQQQQSHQQQQQPHQQQQQPHQQQQQPHQQSFQFSRPQSREAPSNHPQYQTHVPTSSPYYQIPSPYHQSSSPQLPRAPSREQMVPRVPSREQAVPRVPSREQLIPRTPSREQITPQVQYPQVSENYNNYSQSHSYYSVQSQPKPTQSSNTYKTTTSSHSYPAVSQQQNVYYKQMYSPQSQMSHQNVYPNTRPNNTQLSDMAHQHQQQQQHQNSQSATVSNDSGEQGGIRTTHNLPPIAALSNYHSSRSVREPTRPTVSNSRTRPFTTSSYTSNTNQNAAITSNSSIIQQTPTRSLPNTSVSVSDYHQSYRTYTSQPQQHHSQYQYPVTVTTQNYTQVIMTTSNNTSNYYPVSSQTTQSSSHLNYQASKSNPQNISRSQSSMVASTSQQPQQNSVDPNINGKLITKRESPLDLSVKTVRTPADSTLGDTDNEARNKYYLSNRTAHPSISTHNYPRLDVNSFRRNLTQRSSAQMPSATAPKVEFHPNFNVPSLNQPPKQLKRPEDPKRSVVPEKAHSSGRPMYNNKNVSYPSTNSPRYPTVSIPSAAHVNSYIQAQEVPLKNQLTNNVTRMDFPTPNHKSNSVYAIPSNDLQKKRPADIAPVIVPNKVPKLDPWRESIDMQIEQRLMSYKQQQQTKSSVPTTKPTMINGSYTSAGQEKTKNVYPMYQKPNYENMAQHVSYGQAQSHYHTQSNHSQTYVPSPATHQYPGYAGLTNQHPQTQNTANLNVTSRSNSNPSLTSVAPNTKNHLGGAVDKRVLSLLRNSLEIKGQKKVFEQHKSHENYTQHPRSDIQHPSTDVTAPLQPKPGLIGRNNVSPFTPTSFPDNSNTASIYNKFHIPKAVDSVNFEINKNQNPIIDKHILDTVITNHTSSNSDYDGLAAFLAARIRTKGELKQGGQPNQNVSNNNSSISESRLHGIIENQLKSPIKQDTSQSSSYCASSGTTTSSSPPKLSKERQTAFAPRKRLFSRNEEDPSNNSVPPRDKSGLRSSSETSVFDFPDSDSETDINGRESLEAMRKGRKSSLKQSTPINIELKPESPGPPSPGDDIFSKLCDNFVEQLKSGAGKKKVKRKKPLEPEVLAKLEPFTAKEKPFENEIKPVTVEVKEENVESDKVEVTSEVLGADKAKEEENASPASVDSKSISTPESELKQQIQNDSKSNIDSTIKKEDPVFVSNKENVRRRLISSSDSDSETESKKKHTQSSNKVDTRSSNLPKTSDNGNENKEEKKENESPQKSNEILPIIRPAKKPSFGDGSDFYPGWEEGVYKYKKSLRMPPTLIQVSRPPQFHRLSTSLPDLDPYPQSPSASIVTDTEKESSSKTKLKKIKSEPLDSDNESNSSLNLFNKKTNYDSEGSASVRSLPNTAKEMSILDRLLERCGGRRKRKIKRKEDHSPKIIPKSENSVELLPTPGLEIKKEDDNKEVKKLAAPVIKSESALLGFRKTTINNFKDAFIKSANSIVGVNEQFTTVVLKSRTRKETRVLKQKATIKEVFGEDRPASAPPVTCVNDIQIKEEITEVEENSCLGNLIVKLEKQSDIKEKQGEIENLNNLDKENEIADTKQMLKNKLLNKGKKKEKHNLLKGIADKKIKMEIQDEMVDETRSLDDIIIKRDPDEKSETPSIDGDDGSISGKKRGKFGKMRRKLSSGFDYIRKKKKVKKEVVESDCCEKKKKKVVLSKTLESVDDIQKEIKTWVLNKGIGETHLHRSARLGYTDVTAYCLEKMDCQPSPKDNAGYTPLHEACSRGHLHIAKLLLLYGANASESAQGGIRPLHEAVENGFVEIARLLLSYGADPKLATYSGLTPLALTNDEITKEFLKNHLNDIEGEPSPPWISYGPASFFDPIDDIGYNILDEIPDADPELEEDDIEFEISENLLPNLYTLRGESSSDRWILLQDLSNLLKIKSRDALLRQICPPSTSSANVNYKSFLRELKMSDFLEQAHCCQFLNAGEKVNTRASKIALVKYTDKVKELLNVEAVIITTR